MKSKEPIFIHEADTYLSVGCEEVELLRYIFAGDEESSESPRPYFHPIRTVAGNLVSAYRPWDHRWHKGLSMTCADLNDDTYWGGPTYVRDKGYISLDNHGKQLHREWLSLGGSSAVERVDWISSAGETIIEEQREIAVSDSEPRGYVLSLRFILDNVSGKSLEFGSPTTNGRPNAGYGGLFWRPPRSFYQGRIISDGGESSEEMMGRRSGYLAYIGRHDRIDAESTVLFVDAQSNPRHPTQWFVRTGFEPMVAASFMFDEVFTVPPGEKLDLSYDIGIYDGALDIDEIVTLATQLLNSR